MGTPAHFLFWWTSCLPKNLHQSTHSTNFIRMFIFTPLVFLKKHGRSDGWKMVTHFRLHFPFLSFLLSYLSYLPFLLLLFFLLINIFEYLVGTRPHVRWRWKNARIHTHRYYTYKRVYSFVNCLWKGWVSAMHLFVLALGFSDFSVSPVTPSSSSLWWWCILDGLILSSVKQSLPLIFCLHSLATWIFPSSQFP